MNNNYQIEKISHQISYYPKKRMDIFNSLTIEQKSEIIKHLSEYVQKELCAKLDNTELIEILERLDPDEATDILQVLPERRSKLIIAKLNEQLRSGISLLLKFDPDTAAGLMDINYIHIDQDDSIVSAAKQVKIHEQRTGKTPLILVMNKGALAGYLPGHELGFGRGREKVWKHTRKIKTIKYSADTEEIIDIFRKYPHNKIVVIGERENVLGVIYSDDVLKILHEKEASSLYDFAGVHDEESVYDSIKNKVRYRYKWLFINLGTGFLAAFTVSLFDETISKYVLLAIYMPIVAGMGGNAGTQTLAIMVRGITLKQIGLKTMWRTLRNEVSAGFINGLLNGLFVIAIVYFKDGDWKIGLILALAMINNLVVAAFFGTIVPLIMKRLGKDPASSATIFITTATDVLGFLVFLGLATVLLG